MERYFTRQKFSFTMKRSTLLIALSACSVAGMFVNLSVSQNGNTLLSKTDVTDYFADNTGLKTEDGLPSWLQPAVIVSLVLNMVVVFLFFLYHFCRRRGAAQGYSRLPSGHEEEGREVGVSASLERRLAVLEEQITQVHDDNRRRNRGEGDVNWRSRDDERISKLEQKIKELCDDRYIHLRCSMTVTVTLDKDTMNPYLRVSEDGRSVRWTEQRQNLPDNPERFDKEPYILGKKPERTVWGYYWEVEVENKKYWELGVAKDSVPRKGQLTLSPKSGFFVLSLWNEKTLEALTELETPLNSVPIPKRVGVHVDYREMKVSFYNAVDHSHIYTFEEKIDKTVLPFISPGNKDQNPLIIS